MVTEEKQREALAELDRGETVGIHMPLTKTKHIGDLIDLTLCDTVVRVVVTSVHYEVGGDNEGTWIGVRREENSA